jgi:nucleoside-diphosphate kinase
MKKIDFKSQRTLAVVKPDGVQRSLIGEIIKRFEQIGLKLVAIKILVATPEFIEKHYTLDPGWRKMVGEKTIKSYKAKGLEPPSEDPLEIAQKILDNLKKYVTSGPVVAMVWQGAHAVQIVRKLVGGTEPLTSDVGTIRGDYVLDSYQMGDQSERSVRNLIHASGTISEAEVEVSHWFSEEEIMDYKLIQERILYDVNLDGILE